MLVQPPTNDNVMVTGEKWGFRIPVRCLNLQATTLSLVPMTYRGAVADPNWCVAMIEELTAQQQNHTWDFVPCLAGANVVSGKWVYRHKFAFDGSLDRYKAR